MSLRTRLFLTTELTLRSTHTLNEQLSHYLVDVLRAKVGEKVRVFNDKDGEWEANITNINKKLTVIELVSQLRTPTVENKLHLAFSPIKNVSASFIIQKATELGVTDIWPVLCKRTIVDKVNDEKLKLTAVEAAEQSERLNIPQVHPIQKLAHFLEKKPFMGKLIFCYEAQEYQSPKEVLMNIKYQDNCLLIGPEGGFSPEEADFIKKFNYTITLNFGKRIMKAETAMIAALSSYNTLASNWV